MSAPVLEVADLGVRFELANGSRFTAVKGISFSVAAGERLGLVGESGSGKTTTALAVTRLIRPPGTIFSGDIRLNGRSLLELDREAMRQARLKEVSYIPQGAMNSLNPVARVEKQFFDGAIDHGIRRTGAESRKALAEAFAGVGLSQDVAHMYPHELSGGMKQRACIAISAALGPSLIVADEPTSALDVISQKHVMESLGATQRALGSALILIGHDMGVMAQFVDRIAVMRNGEIVEIATTREIFEAPRHAYTRQLIESVPTLKGTQTVATEDARSGAEATAPVPASPAKGATPRTRADTPLIELRRAGKVYRSGGFLKTSVTALGPMNMVWHSAPASTVAVVGQSGSGKSTLAGLMGGYITPSSGSIVFQGADVAAMSTRERRRYTMSVQAVLQDPFSSFNPFYRVEASMLFPLRRFGLASGRDEAMAKIEAACREVGLNPANTIGRYPHQLSGGQRQRLMVARAFLLQPRLLIADEPVSMVDASIRMEILEALATLQKAHGIPILYITHDLTTAYHVSDYTVVLYRGRIVEAGRTADVIAGPRHPYTRQLVDSIPWPDPDHRWFGSESRQKSTPEDLENAPSIVRELGPELMVEPA